MFFKIRKSVNLDNLHLSNLISRSLNYSEKHALSKIPKFYLISWCWNFVKGHSFGRVSGDLRTVLRKLCLSEKFTDQEIRWNFDILRNVISMLWSYQKIIWNLYLNQTKTIIFTNSILWSPVKFKFVFIYDIKKVPPNWY